MTDPSPFELIAHPGGDHDPAQAQARLARRELPRTLRDFKASAEYRKTLLAALVQDALELAVARAGGAA